MVLAQTPGGGTSAVLGSAVHLMVSNGKGEPVIVPRVTGLLEADAVKTLRRLDLVAVVEYVPVDDPALDGIVLQQTPIGDGRKVVDVGATVTLVVGQLSGGGNGDGGANGGGNASPEAVLASRRRL